jgi:hypothetical protein
MDFEPDKELVDTLCREDRVRDVYQPRLHDAPKFTEFNNCECKQTRFGGWSFTTFEHHLQDIEVWVHEFTEQAVHYVIEMFVFNRKLNRRWKGITFYRSRYAFASTPWHILTSLVTSAGERGGGSFSPTEYWDHLKSSRVQSRLTEFLQEGGS